MARTSQRQVLAKRQDAAQPSLLDDSQFPVEAAALESVRHRRYEFKGLRLTEDDAKALRLVELICLKWGVKKIARDMMISPHTVRAARRLLVTQGKLAPYKQRVVEKMEDAIEAGVDNYLNALEEGRVPAAQIPVGVAIMFDKRALAMGEPTSIRGTGEAMAEDLKVEDINAIFDRLPLAKVVEIGATTDFPSTESMGKPQQTEGKPPVDVTLDVNQGQPVPVPGPSEPVGIQPTGLAAAVETEATLPESAAGGGGGSRRAG